MCGDPAPDPRSQPSRPSAKDPRTVASRRIDLQVTEMECLRLIAAVRFQLQDLVERLGKEARSDLPTAQSASPSEVGTRSDGTSLSEVKITAGGPSTGAVEGLRELIRKLETAASDRDLIIHSADSTAPKR